VAQSNQESLFVLSFHTKGAVLMIKAHRVKIFEQFSLATLNKCIWKSHHHRIAYGLDIDELLMKNKSISRFTVTKTSDGNSF
jgi:hypothetical protein